MGQRYVTFKYNYLRKETYVEKFFKNFNNFLPAVYAAKLPLEIIGSYLRKPLLETVYTGGFYLN